MGAGVPIDGQVRTANCRYIDTDLFMRDHEAYGVVSLGHR